MVSLLAITFLVELTIHLVNTIGATTINNLVCRDLPAVLEILWSAAPTDPS